MVILASLRTVAHRSNYETARPRYPFTIADAMNTRTVMNILCWLLIAVLAAATLRWVVWASDQPRPHTIWGELSKKPLN
jgi:hypothetical protein